MCIRDRIKRVCTKNGPKNQTYMLAELDPPESVTGWPWHSEDGMLNVDFINKLRECVTDMILHKTRATLDEVHHFVKVSGIDHSSELSKDHVKCIVDVLVNDNRVEPVPHGLAVASGPVCVVFVCCGLCG
eukprot:TRINITY_DN4705_c0_g1_i2.p1 TRINITY_DN4705_c0_g1~~TRINITY_DN4705_c0_g1_i2.p1  ORF type:complete len:130 (-),score=26.22 TRINITY_DN4705_c0_g1_i2:245-634(-)